MPTRPRAMRQLLAPFAPLFSRRVWSHALVLVVGTLLAPGKRTVCAALRAMGLSQSTRWTRDHRVRNRAKWSSRAVSRVLLGLLVATFAPTGPRILGLDETIERRWGAQIAARGRYRDAVRSSKDYLVTVSGLRWIGLLLLVPIPWAGGVWALPFLTALAPSERHDRAQGRRHKQRTDWARQLLLQARRHPHAGTRPDRTLVVVADSGYAASALLACCARLARPLAVVTRLRLDAALYDPAPPRRPGQTGRPRVKGARLPTLAARLADPATAWTAVTVAHWYGEGARTVEVASATAVWYHSGLPPVALRRGTRVRVARPRPGRALHHPGVALHRSDHRAGAGPRLVRAARASGSDVRRGPAASGRRDPAPVVRLGDSPHHPGAAGALLARRPRGPSPPGPADRLRASGGLVPQGPADGCGCPRPRPSGVMGPDGFLSVHGRR